MGRSLSAHLVYGARLSELDFKEDLLVDYIDEDSGDTDLSLWVEDIYDTGISNITSYDSEEDSFVGITLVRTHDWDSTPVDLKSCVDSLQQHTELWLEYITNPEVLRVELIPQYF